MAILSSACFSLAGPALADNTGCGLGTMLFKGDSGKAKEILAVTTNGTFGNQTFGITSGTLECAPGSTIAAADVQKFASANMERLARDMAVGSGETLNSFANVIGIKDEHKSAFFTATKDNFDKIYPSAEVTAEQMLVALKDVINSDQALSQYTI